jgi:hypothetical protein
VSLHRTLGRAPAALGEVLLIPLSLRRLVLALIAVGMLACLADPAQAQAVRILTRPGDPIEIVNGENDGDGNSGAPPGNENVENAINGVGQKYLNFLDLNSGFAVTPSLGVPSIVQRIRFYPANDAVPRDPASYRLAGSNAGFGGPFTLIAQGDLALPDARNPGGTGLQLQDLTTNQPTGMGEFQELTLTNTTAYTTYRVIFPTLKDAAGANSMQIAEVQLIGVAVPEPTSLALLTGVGGVSGLGYLVRRFRRRA